VANWKEAIRAHQMEANKFLLVLSTEECKYSLDVV